MAIRTVVTGGFGNGTFAGSIGLVVTRGYLAGAVAAEINSICIHDVTASFPTAFSLAANLPEIASVTASKPTISGVARTEC